ncbi:MAG TPA: hypothetical protein ENK88_07975, partial [Campylobacterales bacterium]|nr:hypothetical protein [Campylobacterales bacterium]
MTKLIFVNENENIFEACMKQGFNLELKHLEFISKKANNNYIGYYQFLEDEVYYKIYILPKITPRVENNEENKKNFIVLLSKYYELKNKYSNINFKTQNKNIVDFSLESEKEKNKSDELNDFIAYKYQDALQTIESFFKKHKNSLVKEKKFYSQNIRHQFDLKRNILELDKSKIHQRKREPYLYSKIATISVEVLHHFLKHKGKNRDAKKLKNRIEAKYNSDNYSFKVKEINSKKVLKLFKNSDEKELYLGLLTLLGIESYFEDNSYKEMLKLHNQHAHFFRPEKLFEWKVYDYLLKNSEFSELYYEGLHSEKTKESFYLESEKHTSIYSSNPDLIGKKENESFIIDAKWKVLDEPKEMDIQKLARDAKVRGLSKGILIYPKQSKSSKFKLNHTYSYKH